jgi:hypothetical protein
MATPVHARYALLAAVLLMPAVACELLVSSDVYQCSSSGDCAARGGPFAFPGTTCVDHVCVPGISDGGSETSVPDTGGDSGAEASMDAADPAFACANTPYPQDESPSQVVTYTRTFQDVQSAQPLTQIGIRICALDPSCSLPRVQDDGGTVVIPDDNGKVTVQVGYGFRGLIEVNNLSGGPQVVTPAFLDVTPPLIQDASVGPTALMVSPVLFKAVATLAFPEAGDAGPVVTGLAHIFFRTNDCLDNPLANIAVDSDSTDPELRTRRFYFVGGNNPDPKATATDPGGKGGFINLPTGITKLTATIKAGPRAGQVLGTVSVPLRADYVTYAIITPARF